MTQASLWESSRSFISASFRYPALVIYLGVASSLFFLRFSFCLSQFEAGCVSSSKLSLLWVSGSQRKNLNIWQIVKHRKKKKRGNNSVPVCHNVRIFSSLYFCPLFLLAYF